MRNASEVRHHLGYRVLAWVLAVALVSGAVSSIIQVILDAQRVSGQLDLQAAQTINLVEDAATQAVYSIDNELAQQVVEGLFAQEAVVAAYISHPDGTHLGQYQRAPMTGSFREITDPIFAAQRVYQTELRRGPDNRQYGTLTVHYDTAPAARTWLERAFITFGSDIATAVTLGLALFIVVHLLLTRPLLRIVNAVRRVEPSQPDEHLLSTPKGHEQDELGLWVNTTNNLLVAIGESQQQQREAEDRASRLSRYDQLTGLPSRDTFMELLEEDIRDSVAARTSLSLICCGLDDFKSLNEQYGFAAGDMILQTVADRLTRHLSPNRFTLGRLGSDQFVIAEKGLKDEYHAADSAEMVLGHINQPVILDDKAVSATATMGVALFPRDAQEPDRLLQSAEQTMSLAKEKGHNHFQFYVARVDEEIRERKKLEKDLSKALSKDQFHLVYQPQINLQTRRIIGAEALLRWEHPERGLVPPDLFIPLAERNGSIVQIGQWVLEQSCEQAAKWAAGGMPLRIAVNLSAVQLHQDHIVEDILDTLRRHNIPAGRLELEVTETSFMTNLDEASAKLQQLNRAGISVAVDDFGTGYSSLTYLKKMPVQHLKIDKQFIHDLLINDDDTRIANTIIDLGKSLNLTVVAEGVENAEQDYYLSQRGCQLAQGYFFSKPLKPTDFEQFFTEFHRKISENNT